MVTRQTTMQCPSKNSSSRRRYDLHNSIERDKPDDDLVHQDQYNRQSLPNARRRFGPAGVRGANSVTTSDRKDDVTPIGVKSIP